MKTLRLPLGVMALITLAPLFAAGQYYELEEMSWNNEAFVKRFMGSYGVISEIEPEITPEEGEVLQTVVPMIQGNQIDEAIRVLEGSLTIESTAAIYYTIGNLYLQIQRFDDAIRQYNLAIDKLPTFRRAYKNLGVALVQKGEFAKAKPHFIEAIQLGGQDSDLFGLLGYCYLNESENNSALDAYRLASMLDPKNNDWKLGKAQALQAVMEFREAAALLGELIESNPGKKEFYTSRANAFLSLQEPMQAAYQLEALRRIGRADGRSLKLLADIYLNASIPGLSQRIYDEAIRNSDPISFELALRAADAFLVRGHYSEAGSLIEGIESVYSPDQKERLELLNVKAELAISQGESEDAVKTLKEIVKEDPTNGKSLLLLGNHYADNESVEEAAFYYERAAGLSDWAAEANIAHARMLVSERKYEEAVGFLKEAQRIESRDYVQRYLDAVEEAVEAYR